jgi:hypothetical protein
MKPLSGKSLRCVPLLACGLLAHFTPSVGAEQALTGLYKGTIEIDGPIRANPRPTMIYFDLIILRVDGASITATWSQSGGQCPGDHPMEGRLNAGQLFLKMAHPRDGCMVPPVQLTVSGSTLDGTYGKRPIRLRR